jgi:phosphoribosylanthranilate isomerase
VVASGATIGRGADDVVGSHFRDFIQVAGIGDPDEAAQVMACGVRYLGFPLRLPVHREDLSEDAAAAIIRSMRPPCFGVPITYQDDADEIAEFTDFLGAALIQLHGDISRDELVKLRRRRPGLVIIKSLVIGSSDLAELIELRQRLDGYVDAFITDTFDAATGASGATGKTHDWEISRRLIAGSPKPVILAGGLTPDNVREAIHRVRPAGVDSHTGVENASGRKDPARVRRFVDEARAGFGQLQAGRAHPGA